MEREELCRNLNSVIQVLRDGQDFYADAANRVDSSRLKALFREISRSRHEIIADLNRRVRAHGGKPSPMRTPAGALGEALAKAKAEFSTDEEAELTAALKTTEDRALEQISQALLKDLPEADRRALRDHYDEVLRTREEVRRARGELPRPT